MSVSLLAFQQNFLKSPKEAAKQRGFIALDMELIHLPAQACFHEFMFLFSKNDWRGGYIRDKMVFTKMNQRISLDAEIIS